MKFRFVFPGSGLGDIRRLFGHVPGIDFDPVGPGRAVEVDVPFDQTRLFENVCLNNPQYSCVAYHRRFQQGLNFRNGDRPISIYPEIASGVIAETWRSTSKLSVCPRCAAHTGFRDPCEIPHLSFVRKPNAHILSGASLSVYASEHALNKISDANLDAGLTAVPVESDGQTRLRWFLLRGHPLSFPAGPFGLWNEKCHVCNSYAPRRYQFGEIYLRPETSMHWMDFPSSRYWSANLLVSEQLYNWLLHEHNLISATALEFALRGGVCGWYPEDAGYFYLPRYLQSEDAPVLDPVVLHYMTFDTIPILGSPGLVDPSWRKDAIDHGLFRNLDQALNWEHDAVFILDLTSTDTDCIFGEDIAKFRNLRELVLRHTKVQTLPDAVFHLKNLNRIDIRDTPIPPAEIERIRSQLPARVKLVANRPRRTIT